MKLPFLVRRESLSIVNLLSAFAIILISYISYSIEFSQVDIFNRDALQLISTNKSIDPKIATVSINVKNNFLNQPLRHQDFEIIINELNNHKPQHLIFVIEPNDITSSKAELVKIRKLFEDNKIWLNAWITGRDGFTNFSKLNGFENYKYFFQFNLCLDTNGNFSPRRMLLKYYNIQQSLLSDSLKNIGIQIRDSDYFDKSYDYLNTKQIYTKSLDITAFGNYSAEQLINRELPPDLLLGKTVFVGRVDEFSLLTANNIFNSMKLGKASYESNENRFYPASHIVASNANTLTTGDYVKLAKNNLTHVLVTIILVSLFIIKGSYTKKLLLFLISIPILVLLQTIVYILTSTYIELSSTYVFLIVLQYLLIPIFSFKIINDQRAQYYTLLNNSRIDTFLEISEKIAHDIRSPLSVINLLTSRVKFQNAEHEAIFKNSVDRIDAISSDLLKKYKHDTNRNNFEKVNLLNLILDLKNEKQLIDPNIKYSLLINIPEETLINANKTEILRVFSNLLDNSINALEKNQRPEIKINLEMKPNFVELTIEDNGIGISSSALKILGNERFSTKSISTGNGIGILHAKRSIEQLGGSFEIKSSEGHYTKVVLNLPS